MRRSGCDTGAIGVRVRDRVLETGEQSRQADAEAHGDQIQIGQRDITMPALYISEVAAV